MGHLQTEAPYFQPEPVAPEPFSNALGQFNGDPNFKECKKNATCQIAWGMRIIDSSDSYFHSSGLYSWFNNYGQDCVAAEGCQQKILEVKGSQNIIFYNLFTKATLEIGSGGKKYDDPLNTDPSQRAPANPFQQHSPSWGL